MNDVGYPLTAPALNYCHQCGGALVNQRAFGQMRRYCPACRRVVFREHKVAAALLLPRRNEVLLVRRAFEPQGGCWTLPAGFVNYDEAPADAAIRECHEETGIETEVVALLDVIAGREHEHGANIVIVYEGRIVGGELQAGDDAADARFFAADALPSLAFLATHQVLDHWQRRLREEVIPCDAD